jgi:hypothetical protein
MNLRKRIYFGTSGFLVLLALTAIAYHPASSSPHNVTSALMVFIFPAGFALAWFVEQTLEKNLKHKMIVRIVVGIIGVFWLYLAVTFFGLIPATLP